MDAFLFFPLMGIIFVIIIPLLVGILVYRDARSRGMDAMVWALVAVLIPGFIGLIIYLIMRKDFGNLRCAKCNNLVSADFLACPYCGNDLKGRCPNCNRPVEPDYKICPNCAHELTPMEGKGTYQSSRKSDNTLVLILIAAVLVPIIVIGGIFAASFMYSTSYSEGFTPVFEQEEMIATMSILDDMSHITAETRSGIEAIVDTAPDKIHIIDETDGQAITYLALKNEERLYHFLNMYMTDQGVYEIRIESVPGYDKNTIPEYLILDLGSRVLEDVELYLNELPSPDFQRTELELN
ncbi:MAG TPA: zinc ribbon domain-containing protein [Clostridiaceae bacterium]|nr:zinc ribbon domain-containing protein [Clostridiaceae bacterium]